jgi:hypothetical protein
MKRINVVLGLAVMAVLALSAFAVSSAFAAAPELIRAGSGAKPEVVKGEIKGTSKGNTVLETANKTTVTCTAAKAKGGKAVTTKETSGTKFLFTGCVESALGGKCNTKGLKAGEIETSETIGLIGFKKGTTEVDLELRPKTTTSELKVSFVLFECVGGFAKIEAKGAVIGMFGVGELNTVTKSLKTVFAKGTKAGEQELTEMEGGFMTVGKLESNLNGGAFENSNQQGEGLTEFEESVELT